MDTIMIIRDSVATCVKGMAATCQPCAKDAGACCNDVIIAGIICLTILLLAIIAVFTYLKAKSSERKGQDSSQENPTGGACSNNKVKAEYISKLLKHLESLAIKENNAKYDKDGSDNYINVLKNLIKTGTIENEKEKS